MPTRLRIARYTDRHQGFRNAGRSCPDVEGRHRKFEDVTFGYERHQPVLRKINFEIRAGETIGIVGRSGSGKTTLVNLLCRFYDTCEGRVLVDGVDVRDVASHQLRKHIGVVLQEPFLFRGTIWQNLVYGMPTSSPEQAIASAKAAQAHDFILNSPLGYDTWLGERGAGLSGGERQRMSIARAILYDPPILILDEATSSVDAESEQAIQQALRALTKGRTTIAIAHRLSTLREANRIMVFDRGRLIEQGSHDELLEKNGQYANLVRLQGDHALDRRAGLRRRLTLPVLEHPPRNWSPVTAKSAAPRTAVSKSNSPTVSCSITKTSRTTSTAAFSP